MALVLSTAPSTELMTPENAKDHSRISGTADDADLFIYIAAAREYIENTLSSAFITQTWVLYLDSFPASTFYLPRAPLQSVTHIKYTDEDGNEATVSSNDYQVDADSRPGRVSLKSSASWPTVTLRELNGVAITFVAGYGDTSRDVPGPIRHALRLLVADMHEHRENSIVEQGLTIEQIPFGVRALLSNHNMRDNRCLV